MNVKPGDLAIIVKSYYTENIGKICKIIEQGEHGTGLPSWRVEALAHIFCKPLIGDGSKQLYQAGTVTSVPDAWLRPVSGLPDTPDVDKRIKEPA